MLQEHPYLNPCKRDLLEPGEYAHQQDGDSHHQQDRTGPEGFGADHDIINEHAGQAWDEQAGNREDRTAKHGEENSRPIALRPSEETREQRDRMTFRLEVFSWCELKHDAGE